MFLHSSNLKVSSQGVNCRWPAMTAPVPAAPQVQGTYTSIIRQSADLCCSSVLKANSDATELTVILPNKAVRCNRLPLHSGCCRLWNP